MTSVCTKELLLSIVDDLELIAREILEKLLVQKQNKISSSFQLELMHLLVKKDQELKDAFKIAKEQGAVAEKLTTLRADVDGQNECVHSLLQQFKDLEVILATCLFQAKQKLTSIDKANDVPVKPEDLIKYGHRISASNSICAPLNWQQGDSRRPYPTDLDMRLGFLGKPESAERYMSANTPQRNVFPAFPGGGMMPQGDMQQQQQQQPGVSNKGHFMWQSGEIGMVMKDGVHVPLSNASGQEDADERSSDSSSSSSTDSN